MGEIRVAARAAARDMNELNGMVGEVLYHLQEDEDDKDEYKEIDPSSSPLPGTLPILEALPLLEAFSIGPEKAKWEVFSRSK